MRHSPQPKVASHDDVFPPRVSLASLVDRPGAVVSVVVPAWWRSCPLRGHPQRRSCPLCTGWPDWYARDHPGSITTRALNGDGMNFGRLSFPGPDVTPERWAETV